MVVINWGIVALFALGAGGFWLVSLLVHPYTSCCGSAPGWSAAVAGGSQLLADRPELFHVW